MSQPRAKLASLAGTLRRLLKSSAQLEIKLLPENQLLVRKGAVAASEASSGMKGPRKKPGQGGYEIYVAIRKQASVEARPSQRMRPPESPNSSAQEPAAPRLEMPQGVPSTHWEIEVPDEKLLTIRVRCGPSAHVGEINRILSVTEEILFDPESFTKDTKGGYI